MQQVKGQREMRIVNLGRPSWQSSLNPDDMRIKFLSFVFADATIWRDARQMPLKRFLMKYPQLNWLADTLSYELPRRKNLPDWHVNYPPMKVSFGPWYLEGEIITMAVDYSNVKPRPVELDPEKEARAFDRQMHSYLDSQLRQYHKRRGQIRQTEQRIWVAYAYWFALLSPADILERAGDSLGRPKPDRATIRRWLLEFTQQSGCGLGLRGRGGVRRANPIIKVNFR